MEELNTFLHNCIFMNAEVSGDNVVLTFKVPPSPISVTDDEIRTVTVLNVTPSDFVF